MNETFHITHSFNTQEFIVDISKRTCSCNFWELVGIPCRHVVAALSYKKQIPYDFVDDCYTRDKYAVCYGYYVSPINGRDMWPEVKMDELQPLAYKHRSGRPRKLRMRESGEEGSRKRRPGVAYKCTKCDNFGHNALTCKSLTQDPSALKRKRKVKPVESVKKVEQKERGEENTVMPSVEGVKQALWSQVRQPPSS